MPSRKNKPSSSSAAHAASRHIAFFPLITLLFIVWVIYRSLFRFPVWFDETVGKAIFFGLPVWLYISLTRSKSIRETFSLYKIYPGLMLGIAVGGMLGFAGTLASLWGRGVVIQSAPLFASNIFWGQFFLAMMTGFWESLFFFSWVMIAIQERFVKWSMLQQILATCVIFLAFHIPNTLLRAQNVQQVFGQVVLLFFFALGQSLLFYRWKNLYALTISQAIWGMVLLVHAR